MVGRVLLAVAFSLAAFSPTAVSADPGSDVAITATPCQFNPEIGPWFASGAITDSGTYARTETVVSPPNRPMFSPVNLHETFVFTGSHGTFTIEANEQPAPDGTVGVWNIRPEGSGAYADMNGHGESAFSGSPTPSCAGGFTITLVFTGGVTKVG